MQPLGSRIHIRCTSLARDATIAMSIPALLARSWQLPSRRCLSTTPKPMSRVGRRPISLPPGVEITIGEPRVKEDPTTWLRIPRRTITVQGPLGTLNYEIPPFVSINHDVAERTATLDVEDPKAKEQRAMWGTTRGYLDAYVKGVSEGHTAILRLVGVGYRASVEKRDNKEEYPGQQFLILRLGYTNPIEEGIPRGVRVVAASPTRVLMEGIEKVVVMGFAARVRKWRPPEPYKGKGIFINDQTIKLKGKKGK